MDILVLVAKKVAEHSVAPIQRELDYLISYEGNLKELTDQVTELEHTRDEIKHWVEAERRNGKIIETAIQKWLDEVDGVIEEAHKLEEDPCFEKVGCFAWLSPNLVLRRWQLSKEAKKMGRDAVPQLRGKGQFERVGYLPALYEEGSSSNARGSEKFNSRNTIIDDILEAFTNHKVSKIGVYGLGGVGKTTLVKEVARKAQQEKLFDVVVKAEVSKTPDLRRIQGEIADLLGLQFHEETIAGRASRLLRRIKMEKTILIVLDDIWTGLDLEKVGIPIGDEHNGCKVLMTSRNQDVLHEMDARKDFRLEVLNEEETWSLFEFMAGDVVKDISFREIATKVAKKCAGLPVRVVTVAKALKNKNIHAWKDALKQLERLDSGEMDVVTYSALELSYNSLEGDELKEIFLLCALLIIGYEPTDGFEYLLKCAMGLDIFKHINTVEDARNRLHKIIGSLKASCMLLEGNTSVEIKLHDIVREVAISIASRDQHVLQIKKPAELKEWPTKDFLKRCTKIILRWCHIHKLLESRILSFSTWLVLIALSKSQILFSREHKTSKC